MKTSTKSSKLNDSGMGWTVGFWKTLKLKVKFYKSAYTYTYYEKKIYVYTTVEHSQIHNNTT